MNELNISDKLALRNLILRMIGETQYRLDELQDRLKQVDMEILDIEERAMLLIGANSF